MSRTVLAGIITATLFAASAAPALADQAKAPQSAVVNYAGIDVTDPAGAKLVLRKIERAADNVCDVRHGRKSLAELRIERECVEKAVQNAIQSVYTTKEHRAALEAARAG